MHDLTLALEICRMAEQRLGRDTLPRLVRVGVDLGDDANVEEGSLRFCLEALLAEPPFAHAVPVFNRVEGDVLRLAYLEVDDVGPDD